MKEDPTYKHGRAEVLHDLLNAAAFLSQTIVLAFFVFSCSPEEGSLEAALNAAGGNRGELERVLGHYKDDSAKLAAAQFLIENLPEHYSYRGKGIDNYYATARALFLSGLSPWEQYDSLLHIYKEKYAGLEEDTISDPKIITAKFLIKNIDQAFDQWRSRPWADHLTFDEFCEWLLPYKAVELQSLDSWRDSLYEAFTSDLRSMPHDDDAYGTAVNAANTVNREIQRKIRPFGIYSERTHPFLSAGTLPHFTFGVCTDYVVLSVLTLRSVGIPCVIDETPYWGRFRAGHSWVTILNSRGEELTSEWDVSSAFGTAFFTDKRIPKVYRNTFTVNRERKRYMEESEYKYPFSLCQTDVTSRYFRTADVEIPLPDSFTPSETYAYIATFTGTGSDWSVVDYGTIEGGTARFRDMGRNILYIALGYDGEDLRPVSRPFILKPDGAVTYITPDTAHRRTVTVRRKYFQSRNVMEMRYRILHGKIQGANHRDFSDSLTIYRIDDVYVPDRIPTGTDRKFRYWRYLSPNGSYGNIAEIAFFDGNDSIMTGRVMSSAADDSVAARAFDGDPLTNFECGEPDSGWVGMDMGRPVCVSSVRIVPRSDDNDIRPGDTYELFYWGEGNKWESCGIRKAESNVLSFDGVPKGALMWLRDYTRGMDERPFLINGNGGVEWW